MHCLALTVAEGDESRALEDLRRLWCLQARKLHLLDGVVRCIIVKFLIPELNDVTGLETAFYFGAGVHAAARKLLSQIERLVCCSSSSEHIGVLHPQFITVEFGPRVVLNTVHA